MMGLKGKLGDSFIISKYVRNVNWNTCTGSK